MARLSFLSLFCFGCAAPAKSLHRRGERAPDFTLSDTEGKSVALHDLLARGPVMLAFFPKAFTPG
jgi:peroxiredoxin